MVVALRGDPDGLRNDRHIDVSDGEPLGGHHLHDQRQEVHGIGVGEVAAT